LCSLRQLTRRRRTAGKKEGQEVNKKGGIRGRINKTQLGGESLSENKGTPERKVRRTGDQKLLKKQGQAN